MSTSPLFDHRSLPETVAEALLGFVHDRGLREGDPLPSGGELTKLFGVSPSVLREAQAILAARGLLKRRQGREPTVAVPGDEIISGALRQLARHKQMTTAEFQQCRAGIEVQSAALAAAKAGEATKRKRLQPLLDGMAAATAGDQFAVQDLYFHLVLAELSGNQAICVILSALHKLVADAMREVLGAASSLEAVTRSHIRIAEAVWGGDVAAASDAMSAHFQF